MTTAYEDQAVWGSGTIGKLHEVGADPDAICDRLTPAKQGVQSGSTMYPLKFVHVGLKIKNKSGCLKDYWGGGERIVCFFCLSMECYVEGTTLHVSVGST